jgi:hypothetical protein
MFDENKENKENIIDSSPLTREENSESRLLQKFGIQDSLHPAQNVSTTMIRDIKYYTKIHTSDEPVRIWNDLYGKNTGRFLGFKDAFYDNEAKLSYFPELGNPVEKYLCSHACEVAQIDLDGLGYYHTNLYNSDVYGNVTYLNCNNVREYNGDYFAIDTEKIVKIERKKTEMEIEEEILRLLTGGNKKRKTNKKLKKSKKTHNKKSKKSHNKKSKKSKKVKKSKK